MRPNPIQPSKPITQKLGIKSSFPNIKSAIGLLIALWKATGEKSVCDYSVEIKADKDSNTRIEIDSAVFSSLVNYFKPWDFDEVELRKTINSNPLFESSPRLMVML